MLHGFPERLMMIDEDDEPIPVSRFWFGVDEASEDDMAGPDAGRPQTDPPAEVLYTSPGRAGQAWRAPGTIDAAYGRLEASLVSASGPWTTLSSGGSLDDPAAEGVAGTLWLRYVAHRWSPDQPPVARAIFSLRLGYSGVASIDED